MGAGSLVGFRNPAADEPCHFRFSLGFGVSFGRVRKKPMGTEISIASFAVSIVALAISSVVGYFYIRSVVDQAHKDYGEQQPNIQVYDLSAMYSANTLTLFPTVRNLGKVPAYDCALTMDGWDGKVEISTSHPAGPKFQEHKLSITLSPDAAIRSKAIEPAWLSLSYRDCWGYLYEVSYPVRQVKQGATPTYSIEIDLKHPRYLYPDPSFFEIRKLLGNIPHRW